VVRGGGLGMGGGVVKGMDGQGGLVSRVHAFILSAPIHIYIILYLPSHCCC
jgi:predicted CDP-diglyceride synthetase/phosphatidate cytidylyltransferase